MNDLDIGRFLTRLKEFDALRDTDTVHQDMVDRIRPTYSDAWPLGLDPAVRDALVHTGIPRPYKHQADAITKALNGDGPNKGWMSGALWPIENS